jgi:uncharacterized protein YbjQ (UPF0145 family)
MNRELITTALELPNHRISRSLGVVRGITVRSRSDVRHDRRVAPDIARRQHHAVHRARETSREEAFEIMIRHATDVGATGIVAVRYDATEVMQGVTEVLCYGTAVVPRAAIGRGMALTATIYNLDVQPLRYRSRVYEALAFKVAQQPSESDEHMMARVLALLPRVHRGHRFSEGDRGSRKSRRCSCAISPRALRTWIDIGSPDAARLHKASKAAPRVVVYTHKDPAQLVAPRRRAHPPAPTRSSCTP